MLKTLVKMLLSGKSGEMATLVKSRVLARSYTKNRQIITGVTPKKLLVLAPHPDDEAVGMGGTLAMHLQAGSKVTVVFLTDGGLLTTSPAQPESDIVRIRRDEALSLAKTYGITPVFWPYRDGHLELNDESVARMRSLLAEINPDVVCLPSFFDCHYDHFTASALTISALKNGFEDLLVMAYEVSNGIPFPNQIVDISSVFDTKLTMIGHYALPLTDTDYKTICTHRNALHYATAIDSHHQGYAEAFLTVSAKEYCELYEMYYASLKASGSLLIKNTGSQRIKP